MTERRRFIVKAGGAVAAIAASAIVDAPNVIAQPKVQWRMSTAWTRASDIVQGAAERLAKVVEETSGGRFRIEGSGTVEDMESEEIDSSQRHELHNEFRGHIEGDGLFDIGVDLVALDVFVTSDSVDDSE